MMALWWRLPTWVEESTLESKMSTLSCPMLAMDTAGWRKIMINFSDISKSQSQGLMYLKFYIDLKMSNLVVYFLVSIGCSVPKVLKNLEWNRWLSEICGCIFWLKMIVRFWWTTWQIETPSSNYHADYCTVDLQNGRFRLFFIK